MDYSILQQPYSLNDMQNLNSNICQLQKFMQNVQDYNDVTLLQQEQIFLSYKEYANLYPSMEQTDYRFFGHPLYACASCICAGSYLIPIGVIQLVCGAISCAMCGKIIIKVSDNWYESAIDQVIHFAESGKRKTSCISRII